MSYDVSDSDDLESEFDDDALSFLSDQPLEDYLEDNPEESENFE